jgi:hypothetical protein
MINAAVTAWCIQTVTIDVTNILTFIKDHTSYKGKRVPDVRGGARGDGAT